jgi:hypothetical protein
MANERKPSILNDRRSIGSEKDLDEYGVWVKSESEEFAVLGQGGSFEQDFPLFEEKHGPAVSVSSDNDSTVVSDTETAKSGSANSDAALSAALLLKIAEELASIKLELATLKAELDRRHNEGGSPVPSPAAPVPPPDVPATSVSLPIVDNLPAKAEVEEDEVMEADFDDFSIPEITDEEFVTEEPETDFFDSDIPSDKITLTSDELDLLDKDAGENIEEGDEINNILGDIETPAESMLNQGAKVEEITLEDIPEEPVVEGEPAIDGDTFDINIESEEEALPDDAPPVSESEAETNFDEDAFDIDNFDTENDDTNGGAKEGESLTMEPETADIAFDPFGSLPDEDETDGDADSANEEDIVIETSAEEPLAEETSGQSTSTDETGLTPEDDPFADFSSAEEPVFDNSLDDLNTPETIETEEEIPEFENQTGKIDEAVEPPDAIAESSSDFGEADIAGVDADPALSQLLDEDFHQIAPVPEDTAYLDDEKPLELDEAAEPEFDAHPEALVPLPEEKPDAPQETLSSEESSVLQGVPQKFKQELRTVLSYMDILLEALPEEKIEEFARSEHFEPYKKLFQELGLA